MSTETTDKTNPQTDSAYRRAHKKDAVVRGQVFEIAASKDSVLTDREVRAMCGGWCRQTLITYVKKGLFPAPFRIGIKKYWKASLIQEWISKQQGDLAA